MAGAGLEKRRMDKIECIRCGPLEEPDPSSPFCTACGEPRVAVPLVRPGARSIREDRPLALEKFVDFLPLEAVDPELSLGEGMTPLVSLRRVGAALGLPAVRAKNEAQNPTASFKDRGTVVAVQKTAARGIRRIGTVSTGNMAASTAAYGARAGLETFVLLKEGTTPLSLRVAGIHRPHLIAVDGDYGELFRASLEVGKKLGIVFMNSVDPHRLAGYKLTAFEIFLQLGRRPPGMVVAPVSSGGHLIGLMLGFQDLEREGMIRAFPRFVGVQASGCAPLAEAFRAGSQRYERPMVVRTIAHAIANPAPPAGNAVLRLIREREGLLLAVSDGEMLEAQRELAEAEGVFCQPESATTLAALKILAASGQIEDGNGEIVLVLTGSGLKTPGLLEAAPLELHNVSLEGLEEGLARLL
jgi:threonine synthase